MILSSFTGFLNEQESIYYFSVKISFSMLMNSHVDDNDDYDNEFQKQPPRVLCKKRCSLKFCKIHRNIPMPESLF